MCSNGEWDDDICELSLEGELAQAVELYYMLPHEDVDLSEITPKTQDGEAVTVEKSRKVFFNRVALGSLRTRISDLEGGVHLLEFDRRESTSGAWVYRSDDTSATARVRYEKTDDGAVINGSFTVPGKNSKPASTYMIRSAAEDVDNCCVVLKVSESQR